LEIFDVLNILTASTMKIETVRVIYIRKCPYMSCNTLFNLSLIVFKLL
jgi:hypothetical protein